MSSIQHPNYENIPKPSLSSSTTTSSSSTNERRQKRQAERMRQLQDIEQQITDATNWTKRRADLVTADQQQQQQRLLDDMDSHRSSMTPSTTISSSIFDEQKGRLTNGMVANTTSNIGFDVMDQTSHHNHHHHRQSSSMIRSSPSSKRSSMHQQHNDKVDLRDASLEDLEGMIAASAQRLANYRIQKSSETLVSHARTDSSDSLVYSPTKASTLSRDSSSRFADLLGDEEIVVDDDDNDSRLTRSDANLSFSSCASLLDDPYPLPTESKRPLPAGGAHGSSGAGVGTGVKKEKKVVTSPSASSYVSSIRNKFEMAGNNDFDKSQQLLHQFDPLLSTKKQQQHQKLVNKQRPEQLDLLTGSPSSSDETSATMMQSTQPVLSPFQSNLRSVAEVKEQRRKRLQQQRPAELNVSDLVKDRSNSSTPKTPTRLPTPRSTNTPGTFPRTSYPSTSNSPSSRRMRTLSTVDKEHDTMQWLENEGIIKPTATKTTTAADMISLSSSSSTMKSARRSLTTTKADNKRVQSIMSPPSRSSSTVSTTRRSTSMKKIEFANIMDDDSEDPRGGSDGPTSSTSSIMRRRKTKSTHSLRSLDTNHNNNNKGGEHVGTRSARTRTISMLSAGSGANRRSVGDHLADFDPLLEDEKLMKNTSLLDNDDDDYRWESSITANNNSKKKYPPLRARVVSMTTSASTTHHSARKVAQERANRTKNDHKHNNGTTAPRPHETQSMTTKAVSGRKRGKVN
ncbi:hypothetical protein BDC45DRAFT_27518 [Circinella umbellata]|nr:hypothetical protein BDC45DRAFT_27518 [Circinella umbellata]